MLVSSVSLPVIPAPLLSSAGNESVTRRRCLPFQDNDGMELQIQSCGAEQAAPGSRARL